MKMVFAWIALMGMATAAAATNPPASPLVRLPDPPPPPPMPNSHHDRPLTPVIGTYYVGRLGGSCDSGTLADGRAYRDSVRTLEAGQRIGISLTSPDLAPTLQVFRQGQPERPLASLAARAGGARGIGEFIVAEAGDHIFRVIAPTAGEGGRWRVELSFDRPIDSVYFSDWFDWSAADRVCS